MSQTSPVSETLKPCPFCGNGAHITEEDGRFFVGCEAYDGCAMPNHCFYEREAAAEAWNRRTSDHAQTPTAQPCDLRDRADRVLGEWWFWDDENLSASQRAEILDGICADTSTDRHGD